MRLYRRGKGVIDILVVDGEGLALVGQTALRLGPLGVAIWELLGEGPRSEEELCAGLEQIFGPPPRGTAVGATNSALTELLDQGVVGLEATSQEETSGE